MLPCNKFSSAMMAWSPTWQKKSVPGFSALPIQEHYIVNWEITNSVLYTYNSSNLGEQLVTQFILFIFSVGLKIH